MPGSYLQSVKNDILALTDALLEEVLKAESSEEIPAVFREWKRELWPVVEKALKQSYINGTKSRSADAGEKPQATRRFKNWRDRRTSEEPPS